MTYTRRYFNLPSTAMLAFAVVCAALFADTHEAISGPRRLQMGICLAWQATPPQRPGEGMPAFRQRLIAELETVASAIEQGVSHTMIVTTYFSGQTSTSLRMQDPRDCAGRPDKSNYDVWFALILRTDGKYSWQVDVKIGTQFHTIEATREPLADEQQARDSLATIGARIAKASWPQAPPPAPRSTTTGVIFVYDTSSSTYQTDPGARNRLNVTTRIWRALADVVATKTPLPFSLVTFDDTAVTIKDAQGSPWFTATSAGLSAAETRLRAALNGNGLTNIGAAFKTVEELIGSRADIHCWHIVMFTDGVPTAGIRNYPQLTEIVKNALAEKSTLSVIELYSKNPPQATVRDLTKLVQVITDDTGNSGEIIKVEADADLRPFRNSFDRISYLITNSTMRDEAILICKYNAGTDTGECGLDNTQPHALRFGAAHKVTFVVDTGVLSYRPCTVVIENQGLESKQTIMLSADQQQVTQTGASFNIALRRGSDRMYLTIDTEHARLNGDWQLSLTLESTRPHPVNMNAPKAAPP